jgi:FXSXX-COOH protein
VTTEVPAAGHELQTELVDATRISLADFELLGDSALANCVRRVLAEAENPGDAQFGFNSSL